MSFSALNIGRQMMIQTGNFLPGSKIPNKPQAGGSYTPTTLEAIYVLRSSLDYQFESAFLTKYKALMQNRLNTLTDQLKASYTNLLNASMGQQIGETADAALRADTRLDGLGSLIQGIQNATGFEDIGVDPDTDNTWRTTLAKGLDLMKEGRLLPDDGLAGYSRNIGNGGTAVQFRALTEYITAASNIGGNLNITMRSEDDPPEIDPGNVLLAALGKIISLAMGGPADPTKFNQKLEQHTTDFKTGGFWSAVNYLYNFAPREINYSYAVGYTVNSNEAGDTDYLINGRFVDSRDRANGSETVTEDIYEVVGSPTRPGSGPGAPAVADLITAPPGYAGLSAQVTYPTNATGEQTSNTPNAVVLISNPNGNPQPAQPADGTVITFQSGLTLSFRASGPAVVGSRTYTAEASARTGNRAKWASFDPTEGYQHEFSGTSGLNPDGSSSGNAARYTNVINRQRVWISGTDDQGTPVWYSTTDATRGRVNILDNVEFRSGTDIFIPGQGLWTETGYANSNIQTGSVFKHTVGPGAFATEGEDPITRPNSITSSLFFNHYEVETRTVDFNNDARRDATGFDGTTHDNRGQLYVYGDIQRSTAVDASKSFEWIDENGDGTAGAILRNTGNVSKSFNGEFVQGLHKIHSVNGQQVVGNEQKQASPIIGNFEIGRYEGIMRSYEMSRHLVPYTPPKPLEVNAANTVPTDWYQAEMILSSANPATVRDSGIWFPYVDDTIYSNGSSGSYGNGIGPRMAVQARNTFNLKREDFLQLADVNDWVEDATGFLRPTYEKKDIPVRVTLTGVYNPPGDASAQPKIFVNGINIFEDPYFSTDGIENARLVSVTGPGADNSSDMVYEVNLAPYLREGLNTIAIQAGDTDTNNEGISVTALSTMNTEDSGGGPVTLTADATTVNLVQGVIATGYGDMGSVVYNNELIRPNTVRVQSRWQTRIVPSTTLDDNSSNLLRAASSPEQTGSSAKTTNSFVELLIDAMNQRKYRDIFKLGLLSNLSKMAIQGQANVPTGASLQGNVSVYFDTQSQRLVVNQDKLVGKS